jgi:hypothetical protein
MSHKLIDKLSDLSDITGSAAGGDVLTYQAGTADWQPAATSGGGSNPRTILIKPTQTHGGGSQYARVFTDSTLIPLDQIGINAVSGSANVKSLSSGLYKLYLAWRFVGGSGLTYDICFSKYYNQMNTAGSGGGLYPVWRVAQMGSVSIRELNMPCRTVELHTVINHNVDWEQSMLMLNSTTMSAMSSVWYSGWYCEVEKLGDYDPSLTPITNVTRL